MFEQFVFWESRFEELSVMISQPEVIQDQARYHAALRERSQIEEKVNTWKAYQTLLKHLEEAQQMLDDPDMAQIAQEELSSLLAQKASLEEKMTLMLLPPDPDDGKNVILEIRAGAGGEEAALFAGDLLRMYEHFAQRHHLSFSVVSLSDTGLGGVKEAECLVSGQDAYTLFKYESGVHRVQRIPVTDSTGKKQTSTCTVAILPEAEEVDIQIDPKDIRMDVFRSTGHGGQYINTTDSAVRLTYLPTGLSVYSQDQKSQLRNRETAMRLLRSRLLEQMREKADADYATSRRVQVGTGDRSERIRTYNFHESRVTDHRIGLTLYRIEEIMNGDLDEIVQALRVAEQKKQLEEMGMKP